MLEIQVEGGKTVKGGMSCNPDGSSQIHNDVELSLHHFPVHVRHLGFSSTVRVAAIFIPYYSCRHTAVCCICVQPYLRLGMVWYGGIPEARSTQLS